MNKEDRSRRSQQRKPQQGTRIEEKKWVVKPYNEENQSLPKQQHSTKPISEFIQPSPESARRHPKSNGFAPNQQPQLIEKTGESEVGLLVFNEEKQVEEEEVRECEKSKGVVDDIRSRLKEIELVAQEPKLSEEQLSVNDRLQEEEVLAVEAIYGENVIVLDREDGLRSFQVNIHIEVPDELVICSKLGSFDREVEFCGIGSEAMATTDNSNRFVHSFKVQYLPPIVLTCLLPKAYPSHCAPFFTISVQWLDAMKISSLCQMLDTIWTGQSGQEIVFPWVDWLQNSSLSHLEFDNKIPLASLNKADNTGDRRAVSECVSPDVDIPLILNYNDDKCNEKFCQNLHECCICLNESPGTKFVKLPCKHFFCRNCMETYSTMHAKEGAAIRCPQIKCRELVPPGLVKNLLGDENFEQWESILFNKSLDSMSDLVYCPRCGMACLEDEDHLAQCPKCFFSFCSLCRDRLHVGVPCMTPEEKFSQIKLKFLQNRQPVKITQQMTKEQCKELDMISQFLTEQELMHTATRCPKCLMGVSRISGCDHMHCSRCEQDFCFQCGQGICQCKQMRQREAMLSRQEKQIRAEDPTLFTDQKKKKKKDPANARTCPICRQLNAKVENNNHILCWYCEQHYCYLCGNTVKKSSEHYGPKGCKQHSAG